MECDILLAPFMIEAIESCHYFWEAGWGENHAGNLTYMLSDEEVAEYVGGREISNHFPINFEVKTLIGKFFLVTRTGAFFRNINKNPKKDLGIVRINKDSIDVFWGFEGGMSPTSELPTHMLCYEARFKQDPNTRLVMHCHPTYTIAMTFAHEIDEKKFTETMWKLNSECVLVFPEGLGMLPWMVCGDGEIGPETAKKMEKYRIVIWPYHGMFASGKTFEETIVLIETVEKNAQIFMLNGGKVEKGITMEQVKELAEAFKLKI